MSEQRNEQRPENLNDARQAMRRRRRRRLKIVRTSIVLGIVLLLLLVGALITWKVIADQQSARRETTSFFPVRGIVVEGQTRYSQQELIEKSGLYVGQSLMGVNKVHAHELLVQNFPYLETVDIGNASFDTLRIRVTETKVMAAVQVDQVWYIVGESNKALEQVGPNDVPENTLQVVGATVVGRTVGASLMDDRSLRVCRTLVAAAQQYNLQGMTAVDMTEKTNQVTKAFLGTELADKIFASPAGPAPLLSALRTFSPLTGKSALVRGGLGRSRASAINFNLKKYQNGV